MSALDELGTWLESQLADARSAQKATDDQTLAETLAKAQSDAAAALVAVQTQDAATLAALQAEYDAYVAGHTTADPPPAPKLVEFVDFSVKDGAGRSTGMLTIGKSFDGAGAVYQMTPSTSTHAGDIPTTGTNPLRLMRFGGAGSGSIAKGLDIGNFTLDGTDQGHLYGGIQIFYAADLKVHDLDVESIPGNAPGPPGETFGLELMHTNGAALTDIVIAGGKVGATLLGYNFNEGRTQVDRLRASGAVYGFALAMWRCQGVQVFNDCDFTNSRKAVNIEQSDGGSYEFNRCHFGGISAAAYVAQISSRNGPCPVTFTDCTFDQGALKVRTFPSATFDNGPNQAQDSAIKCVVGGVDVTSDPSQFLITHTG